MRSDRPEAGVKILALALLVVISLQKTHPSVCSQFIFDLYKLVLFLSARTKSAACCPGRGKVEICLLNSATFDKKIIIHGLSLTSWASVALLTLWGKVRTMSQSQRLRPQ